MTVKWSDETVQYGFKRKEELTMVIPLRENAKEQEQPDYENTKE